MPKVSVIVPIYNVENYIEKCLETLVNQTLENIEIILVNDGSKDNSEVIVKRFLKNYPEKIVYLEKENGGLSDARNYGIPYAKGKYVAFLDSDDYVEKDMYEKMYTLAKKENSDMVQCNFYWEYIEEQKRKLGDLEEYQNKKEMIVKGRVEAWNKLIRREVLENPDIRFPKGLRYEDVEFTYKLVPFINKVSFIKEPFVHYVQRGNSISNSQNERTGEIFDILDNVIKFYKEKNVYEEYKNELEYIYVKTLFCRSLARITKIANPEIQERLIEKTWNSVNEKFPNWKKNPILKKGKSVKDIYLKTINKTTYKIYCTILGII